MNDISIDRLRLASRLLVGAAAANKALLCDELWQEAMSSVTAMINRAAKTGDVQRADDPYKLARK